jgi:hypothetical protein
MPRAAKLYVWATVVAGAAVLTAGMISDRSEDAMRFACYFLMANLASGFKVQLPGITGTMSANFFFVLVAVTTMTLPQSLAIACTATVLQCV